MTLDEAKAAAYRACFTNGDTKACQEALDFLATVAYNAGKVAGWDENVKACVEAQREAAEGMRERAANLFDPTDRMFDAILALPLEEEK